jgi:hypothetical protein
MADLASNLNISQPAVSMSARREERIASENGYSLIDEKNFIILGCPPNPHITFDIFLDLTILIDYFIKKRGWSNENNGHK